MKDEIYETVGLLSLFQGGTPPDVYFQWGGWLVERDAAEGFPADLTEEMAKDGWKDSFVDSAWSDATVDGRIYMVPHSLDITNLIWYNKEMFDKFGLGEPTTWDEFLDICETFKENGIVPLAAGNKGVGWPMGNWAGHLVSRVIGENAYDSLLKLEAGTSFSDPGVVAALELLADMVRKGYFNVGVNVIDSTEARMMFFAEQAAMPLVGQGQHLPYHNFIWMEQLVCHTIRANGQGALHCIFSPGLSHFIVFVLYPAFETFRYSLYDWRALAPWSGRVANYEGFIQ